MYRGRDAGGLSTSSCASSASSPDSDPSDCSSANGSSSSSPLSSTDAGPFESGERGLVMRGGEMTDRECWCEAFLRSSSSDLRVGRFGVDLDCKPGGTWPLLEEVIVVVALEAHARIACFAWSSWYRTHVHATDGPRHHPRHCCICVLYLRTVSVSSIGLASVEVDCMFKSKAREQLMIRRHWCNLQRGQTLSFSGIQTDPFKSARNAIANAKQYKI